MLFAEPLEIAKGDGRFRSRPGNVEPQIPFFSGYRFALREAIIIFQIMHTINTIQISALQVASLHPVYEESPDGYPALVASLAKTAS